MKVDLHEDYLRSIMFGFQDGLVSTTGVVAGIAAGVQDKQIVMLASLVAVSVEASSMATGQYSSEKAVHQMDKTGKHTDNLVLGAILMFFSYFLAGMLPIFPIIIFDLNVAIFFSIAFAFGGLFLLGFIKGFIVKTPPLRSALELFIIGALSTSIGLAVGYFLKI